MSDHSLENAVMQALAHNRRAHANEVGLADQQQGQPTWPDARADADTTAAVLAALNDDDEGLAADIHVEAKDGEVTLWGRVDFPGNRDRAERVALGIAGVSLVHNRLNVLIPVSADHALRRPTNP